MTQTTQNRRLKRVEPGHYESADGSVRVVRIADSGPEQWQAQERVGQFSQWWSWVATCATKREAVSYLR